MPNGNYTYNMLLYARIIATIVLGLIIIIIWPIEQGKFFFKYNNWALVLTFSSFIALWFQTSSYDSTREFQVKYHFATALAVQAFSTGFYFSQAHYDDYNPSITSTWSLPLLVNAAPCAAVVIEFIFDTFVFDLTYIYFPVIVSFVYMLVNFFYTISTNDYYSEFF